MAVNDVNDRMGDEVDEVQWTNNFEIENFHEIENDLRTGVLIDNISWNTWVVIREDNGLQIQEISFRENGPILPENQLIRMEVSRERVDLVRARTSPTVTNAYQLSSGTVLMFSDRRMYKVVSGQRVVRRYVVLYDDVLGPVKLAVNGQQVEVEWAYWDEKERVVRVSGNDAINIRFPRRPRYFTVSSYIHPTNANQYHKFAVVDENWDVSVIDPNAPDPNNNVDVIRQEQHTLGEIHLIWFYISICLFDLNLNRCTGLTKNNLEEGRGNNGGGAIDPYNLQFMGHWDDLERVIILFPEPFGPRLCVTSNVGTEENPQIKKHWFRKRLNDP